MLSGTAKVSVTEYDDGGFVVNDVVCFVDALSSRCSASLCLHSIEGSADGADGALELQNMRGGVALFSEISMVTLPTCRVVFLVVAMAGVLTEMYLRVRLMLCPCDCGGGLMHCAVVALETEEGRGHHARTPDCFHSL